MHSEVGLELPDSDRNMCYHLPIYEINELVFRSEGAMDRIISFFLFSYFQESWAQTQTTRFKFIGHKSNAEIKRKLGKPLCNVSKTFSILVHLYQK